MSENGEIYTAVKNFTLPPAVTGWTNSTSAQTFKWGEMSFCKSAIVLRRKNKGRTQEKTAVFLDFFLVASKMSTGNDQKVLDNSDRVSMSTIKIKLMTHK